MKLVELIPALQTDSSVLDVARGFAERMGKTVTLSADTPGASSSRLCRRPLHEHKADFGAPTGFISNRLLMVRLVLGTAAVERVS